MNCILKKSDEKKETGTILSRLIKTSLKNKILEWQNWCLRLRFVNEGRLLSSLLYTISSRNKSDEGDNPQGALSFIKGKTVNAHCY